MRECLDEHEQRHEDRAAAVRGGLVMTAVEEVSMNAGLG